MDQTASQLTQVVATRAPIGSLNLLLFFAVALAVTFAGKAIAGAWLPGSHPRVRRAVVQTALLAGLLLGAWVGMHLYDRGQSDSGAQMAAHKPQ